MHPVRILLLGGLVLATGCYSYSPSRLEDIQPGQAVRVRLSPEAADRLVEIRLTDLRLMDGTVVEETNGELLLDTSVGRMDPQLGTRAFTQRVNVSLGEIVEVEARQRDNLKTGAAIGALGLAAGIAIAAALQGGEGERPVDPGGETEDRRTRFVLRFGFPF